MEWIKIAWVLIYRYNQLIQTNMIMLIKRAKTMGTTQYSVKGYVMVTLSKDGNQKTTVYALSIADAQRILKQETGLDWYFKGYTEN